MAFATYDKYGRNLAYSKGISRDLYRERREREGGREGENEGGREGERQKESGRGREGENELRQ